MIGERVDHPTFGPGTVVAAFRGGSEWLVRFESGLRFRRARQEFVGEVEAPRRPAPSPTPPSVRPPLQQSRFETRRLVEALRFGVAPAAYLRQLTIGLAAERASVTAGLNRSHELGGAVRAVLGEYGYGKSHLLELSAQEALSRGFLVGRASLDLLELPPHRAFDVYREVLHDLRTPGSEEQGLGPLLRRAEKLELSGRLREVAGLASDPLLLALDALAASPFGRQRAAWQSWLMGGRRTRLMHPATPQGVKFPTIYKVGHNARQVAYLLGGISVLARLAGYSGLCVLIDEAESYSLLRAQQRPKAGLFFAALIHAATAAAVGTDRSPIREDALPQHHLRDYPVSYGSGQSLFIMFAVTRSENQLPLDAWLAPDEIVELDPHPSAHEITEFLRRLQGFHGQAYGYPTDERHDLLCRGGAETLALAVERRQLSIRGLVRSSVDLFDLAYLYPDRNADELLAELGGSLAGAEGSPPGSG